jgi:hypothetical protein
VAVLRDPSFAAGIGQFAAIQSAASSSGVDLSAIDPRDAGEIERALAAFAREPNGGLIVTASASALTRRELIISLAVRYTVPEIISRSPGSFGPAIFVRDGAPKRPVTPSFFVSRTSQAHQPYEFGVKVSVATPVKHSAGGQFVTHAAALPGKPPIMSSRSTQAARSATSRRRSSEFKRRAAIEPVIGHLKEHHRMGRNHLAHASGDAINAVLAAAGYNFRRLLAWLRFLLFRILIALGPSSPVQIGMKPRSSRTTLQSNILGPAGCALWR